MKFFDVVIKLISIMCLAVILYSCDGADEQKHKYLEKGKLYLNDNNLDKARIEFKNALQIDPKYPVAYYYMGQLEEKNKNLRKALTFYFGAIELSPDYVAPNIKIAKIYVVAGGKGFLEKSIEILNKVLVLEPDNSEAKLILSTITYKSGNKNKAINDIENLLKTNPHMIEAISLLAVIYSTEKNIVNAERVLKDGIKNNPNDISLRMSYAKSLVVGKRNAEAEHQLLKIVKIAPEQYTYKLALSKFYSTINQLAKAENVLRAAIEENDTDVGRYREFFRFVAENSSVEKAESELINAVNNKPELYALKFLLSDFYLRLGREDESKHILIKIIADNAYKKEGIEAKVKLASVFYDDTNIPESLRLIKEVLVDYPTNNDALLIQSKISLDNKDALSAINGLRTILQNQPNNFVVTLLLVRAHVMNKDYDLAEDVLKKSVALNYNNPVSYYNYVKYLIVNKKYDISRNILDKALLKFKDNYSLMELKLELISVSKSQKNMMLALDDMQSVYSNMGDIYLKRGRFYKANKEYSKAIIEFEKAYKIMNEKYLSLELIIATYISQDLVDDAINHLNLLKQESPDSTLVNYFLGKIYSRNNNYLESRKYFRKSIHTAQKWSLPYMELASLYVRFKKPLNAIDVYKDAISKDVNGEAVKVQLASLYESKKMIPDAIALYESILSSNSSNLMAKNNLAILLLKGEPDNASLQRAVDVTRGFSKIKKPAFKGTLGWVYVKTGEYEKAIEVFEEVVADAPNAAVFKYYFAVALNRQGQKIRAKKLLQQALESQQNFVGRQQAVKLFQEL